MSQIIDKVYTVEEYFALEKTSEICHEFVHGKLIPIPGESKIANKIAGNCYFQFRLHLRDKPFEIFAHDVRLIIEKGSIYRYPDIAIAPTADNEDTHAILQPVVLVEVISGNSAATDRGDKLKEYLQLPSLQHYLIIDQEDCAVEIYFRQEKGWHFDIYSALTDTIELSALEARITLKDIYDGVSFTP